MACSAAALSFANRRLAALSVMTGLESSEIYDRLYECLRHALLLVHAFFPRVIASDLDPLLDLLTSLHVGSDEPIETGTLAQQGGSLAEAGLAMEKDVSVILSSKVQLALLLPVSAGPETRAAMVLSEVLRGLGEDRTAVHIVLQAHVFPVACKGFGSWLQQPCCGRRSGIEGSQMRPRFL